MPSSGKLVQANGRKKVGLAKVTRVTSIQQQAKGWNCFVLSHQRKILDKNLRIKRIAGLHLKKHYLKMAQYIFLRWEPTYGFNIIWSRTKEVFKGCHKNISEPGFEPGLLGTNSKLFFKISINWNSRVKFFWKSPPAFDLSLTTFRRRLFFVLF